MFKHLTLPFPFLSAGLLLLISLQAHAATGGVQGADATLTNPLAAQNIEDFLALILKIVITIGFPIIVLAVVYTGFLFVAAQGKPDELTKAKQALFWTLVGALIILGAQVLSLAIQGTVNELRAPESKKALIINR